MAELVAPPACGPHRREELVTGPSPAPGTPDGVGQCPLRHEHAGAPCGHSGVRLCVQEEVRRDRHDPDARPRRCGSGVRKCPQEGTAVTVPQCPESTREAPRCVVYGDDKSGLDVTGELWAVQAPPRHVPSCPPDAHGPVTAPNPACFLSRPPGSPPPGNRPRARCVHRAGRPGAPRGGDQPPRPGPGTSCFFNKKESTSGVQRVPYGNDGPFRAPEMGLGPR